MLISVIVPIYNAEKTIQKCVGSLLSQECGGVEIILVNDGSTDGSGALCRTFAQEHPQIRLIEKENGGVSTARNAGLDIARGAYICFVDSDDYVSPDYFAEIRRALAENDWELIRFSYCVDDDIHTKTRRSVSFAAETRRDALPRIIEEICNKALNGPVAKVYRRDIIEHNAIRFPVGASVAEDRAFNISYSLHVNNYMVSPKTIYCVNTQNEQSLSRKQHADLDAQFQITGRYLSEAIGSAQIPEAEKEQYRRAINFGVCRSIYRDAKELLRTGIGWLERQKKLWRLCGQINQRHMHYPKTRYCRLITLPVCLRLTPVIDLIAWKLTH